MPRWRASSTLSKPSSSTTGNMQHGQKPNVISLLTRRLPQSKSSPLRDRLYQPDRDGAKSNLTKSIFSGGGRSTSIMENIIAGQLRGEVHFDWRDQGLTCEIALPLA